MCWVIFRCQKYVKKGYMEMRKWIYLVPLISAPGRSILHYSPQLYVILLMSKISVVKVLQSKWFLFTSKFLWHTCKLLILKIKTDVRNVKYTLEHFIGVAGNICKKMLWKAWNSKTTWDKKHSKLINGYCNIYVLKFYWSVASTDLVLAVVLWY